MSETLTHDIPILFLNKTGRYNFSVAVFVKNENSNASETPFVAWLTIRTQTSAKFWYPAETQVGVDYGIDGARVTAGPVTAHMGSTWEFIHESQESTPYLKEDTTAKPNPGNSIVVKNVAPRQWGGRPYNFGLYKSGTLMATQCNVGVGSQAVFDYTPQLYFGVVNNMKSGHIFKHISLTQQNFCVDLMKYRNGVVVTLSQNGASGEYVFSASGRTSLNLIMEFFQ